jgi:hypothetical protein
MVKTGWWERLMQAAQPNAVCLDAEEAAISPKASPSSRVNHLAIAACPSSVCLIENPDEDLSQLNMTLGPPPTARLREQVAV